MGETDGTHPTLRLTNQFEVGLRLENSTQACANNRMVVDQQNSNSSAHQSSFLTQLPVTGRRATQIGRFGQRRPVSRRAQSGAYAGFSNLFFMQLLT